MGDDDKRIRASSDRRARPRGGRRDGDSKPWYQRHALWVAAASMIFVGWKRVRRIV
jgi:hypothetical protein